MSGELAFPSHGTMGEVAQEGMTLRDYFAAAAISVIPLRDWSFIKDDDEKIRKWAVAAYACADAMLAERKRKP